VGIHLNNFLDDTVGVDNLGTGTANATENWWACPDERPRLFEIADRALIEGF
jgi:hypothetical protein